MTTQRITIKMLLPLLFFGCSGGSSELTVLVTDSAGISIVESSAPQWVESETWTIDFDPVLDLTTSGTGMSYEFHRVADATLLPNGSIAVANRGSFEVRFYSSSGTFVRAVGRDGEGPGEFRSVSSVGVYRGDSIIAFDRSLGRATVFPIGGGEPRVIRLQLPFVAKVHPLDDGTLVAMLEWPSTEVEGGEAGLVRVPLPVVRFSPAGEVIDTVVMSAGHEEVRIAGEYGFSSALPLFHRQSHVVTDGESIYLGSADLMQFELYEPAGALERVVRLPGYDLNLTSAVLDSERALRLGDDPPAWLRNTVAALPVPDMRPAYSDLVVDSERCVWAAEHKGERVDFFGTDPREWEVFDATGAWLGQVQTPPRFTVFEIGEDYVLGVLLDELEVEQAQLLRLHRN